MVDSLLFKRPDQIKFGKDLHRSIQKRTETKFPEVVSRIVQAMARGKGAEIGRNMSRIKTELEDERAGLKSFSTQNTEHMARVKGLKDKGDGSLKEGIWRSMLEKGGIKALSSFSGLEAAYTPEMAKYYKEEVEKQENILNAKTKEYSTLRSSYNPDAPEEGIIGTDYQDEVLFTKPYNDALYNIAEDQRILGNNNLVDIMRRKAKKNKYDLMSNALEYESRLQEINNATRQARAALKEYDPNYIGAYNFIEEDVPEGSTAGKQKIDKIEARLTKLISKTQEWALEQGIDEQESGNYRGYFFNVSSENTKALREPRNYKNDLASFIEFSGYDENEIRDIVISGITLSNKLENPQLQALLFDADPTIDASKDLTMAMEKIVAYDLYNQAGNNINTLVGPLRDWVIQRIDDEVEVYKPVKFDYNNDKLQLATINTLINKYPEYAELYNDLEDAELVFKMSVIQKAKSISELNRLDMQKAMELAIAMERFGLVPPDEKKGRLGTIPVIGLPIGAYPSKYQTQDTLPIINGKIHPSILLDFDENFKLGDSSFNVMLETLNKNKIYNYKDDTLTDTVAQLWKDGQQFSIGNYKVQFNVTPDSDGNNWEEVRN